LATNTVWPKATNFFTVSGVAATRVSPNNDSWGMPSCIRELLNYVFVFKY
jgi:hypothetical protein